jgi:enoyl-CoA hydratase
LESVGASKGVSALEDPILIVEREGRVGVVTLNRPEVFNALNDALTDALGTALVELEADDAIGAIVIAGGTRAFAAGADISAMAEWGYSDVYKSNLITRNWEAIRRVRKPVIASVAGLALGGGCELALACDLIVAGRSARFGLPEIKHGLVSRVVEDTDLKNENMRLAASVAAFSAPALMALKESSAAPTNRRSPTASCSSAASCTRASRAATRTRA